ncbi:MAG: hypothetical protein JW716_05805 [Candidatus Aenigmarchaeota archaeon]|nr:hypothetical protein [Candidatus Aenigmarchaeota archaeon]
MFEYWTLFNGIFVLFIVTGYIIYRLFDRGSVSDEDRKKELYACGERWEQQSMPSGFYSTIINALRIKKLSEAHTGDVSDYLLWVFSGIVIVMMLFVVFY